MKLRILFLLSFLTIFFSFSLYPQIVGNVMKKVEGVVVDGETKDAIPFATLHSKARKKKYLTTDENGKFSLSTNRNGEYWEVSASGYESLSVIVGQGDTIQTIELFPKEYVLETVVVRPTKEKYSKKNNPAVDFVRKLREEGGKHNPRREPYYSYKEYDKTVIALNDFKGNFKEGYLSKGGKFLEDYVDVSQVTGKRLLNLMLKEKVATRLYDDKGLAKEVIEHYRSCGVDEVINQENMRIVLEDALRDVDPYSESITLLQNRFVSPLSAIGPDFYKYFLTDTVFVGGEQCVELSFLPHNPQSMGFNGKIYVPVGDSTMFVKKITMRSPGDINMNLVDNIFINLTYEKDSIGNRHKTYDDVCVELSLLPQLPKIYGRKTSVYTDFDYKKKSKFEEFYDRLGDYFALAESENTPQDDWDELRLIPLSAAERRMGGMMKAMRKKPILYWGEKALRLLESGYLMTGKQSKFDLGPINTLISGNTVEGVRLRLGGMTTSYLNPHLFGSGYVAYGTKDKKWKYNIEAEYSFAKKKYHSYEWPRHGFKLKYQYDIDMLGQHYLFTNADNVFLSLKRKESVLATYRRLAEGEYILELPNHFSTGLKLRRETQESTEWVPFRFGDGRRLDSFNQTYFSLMVRWAPGEKFVQGRTTRRPVNMDAWIFQFTQEYGPKRFWGSAFTLNRSELSVQKRLWFSAFGYTDMILKGGIIWSKVYFPALLWPNANLSYTIQPESYSLMNPMEFANDKYASLDFTYYGLGILFNRIPLLKKLKLREVVTFKGLMGGLSDRNNPDLDDQLLEFPFDAHPRKMSETPYMEAGIGIDNILMFLRLDYVWRLTYRDTPGCSKSGLRVSLHFSF